MTATRPDGAPAASDPTRATEAAGGRRLSREAFAAEAETPLAIVDQLVMTGALVPAADGTFAARDEIVAATARSLVDAGIELGDLAAMLGDRRFGIGSLAHVFTEPAARSPRPWSEVASSAGVDAEVLTRVHAALGFPEADADSHPRADEEEIVTGFTALWRDVDPSGEAAVRVARLVADGTRRIAEGWLDVWDEVARPDATTQGAPTVGANARPVDPTDPAQNASVRMADLSRRLVALVHERQVQATLNARILSLLERVLGEAGRLPPRPRRPPAIAFVDLSGFTSLTEERGDHAAARVATRLQELAEAAVRAEGGRVVKLLGDGVLLRFGSSDAAIRAVLALVRASAAEGLPAPHAGIAAGPVILRDGDVFGRVVNLASRLAARAGSGEVLIEEGVIVALPAGTARFEPRGWVELAGFDAPVAVWAARRQDTVAG